MEKSSIVCRNATFGDLLSNTFVFRTKFWTWLKRNREIVNNNVRETVETAVAPVGAAVVVASEGEEEAATVDVDGEEHKEEDKDQRKLKKKHNCNVPAVARILSGGICTFGKTQWVLDEQQINFPSPAPVFLAFSAEVQLDVRHINILSFSIVDAHLQDECLDVRRDRLFRNLLDQGRHPKTWRNR